MRAETVTPEPFGLGISPLWETPHHPARQPAAPGTPISRTPRLAAPTAAPESAISTAIAISVAIATTSGRSEPPREFNPRASPRHPRVARTRPVPSAHETLRHALRGNLLRPHTAAGSRAHIKCCKRSRIPRYDGGAPGAQAAVTSDGQVRGFESRPGLGPVAQLRKSGSQLPPPNQISGAPLLLSGSMIPSSGRSDPKRAFAGR